jgi:hypothetical protein
VTDVDLAVGTPSENGWGHSSSPVLCGDAEAVGPTLVSLNVLGLDPLENFHATPVFVDGRIYVRSTMNVYCVE